MFKTACALLLGAAFTVAPALAQDAYPSKPITLVVPAPPGGGSDIVARLLGERLGKALGKQVLVENRPGANGMLGTDMVARAAPDGYTLLFTYAAAQVVNPSLYKKVPYDAQKAFAPVAQIGRGGNVLLVRADLPVKTLKEFVAYVKERPGKLSYCSWGNGSGGHLTMESLIKQGGLEMTHVPYKGAAACTTDIIGGQVQVGFGDVSSNIPHIKGGKLRALAVSGPTRVPMLPDVPTMNEAGYPFTTYAWYGVFAPAGTPPAIVKRLNTEINTMLGDPAMRQRLAELNLTDLPITTPEQFGETVRNDMAAWGKLVRELNITLD